MKVTKLWIALFTIGALMGTTRAFAQQEALLIKDSSAWGYSAWTTELTAAGIPYTQIGSADLANTNLSQYHMVITVSVQGSTSNALILASMSDIETFIQQGGVFIYSGCTQSGQTPYPDPPFGGTNTYGSDSYNDVVDPNHPLLAGVANPIYGTSASHNYWTGLPVDAEVLVTHGNNGNPILYVLEEGNGMLIASTHTWEHGWGYGYDAGIVLVNAIDYGWNFDPCAGTDNDGDGWTDCDGDCDDLDASIHPGAQEVCNDGIDQNCDGQTNEADDNDGDGYTNCDTPSDCNDFEAAAYPGGLEVCDYIDNDCDGWVDEDFDVDGDGWSTCAGDCDDNDAAIYPNAAELCNGVDDDCDGSVDEATDDDGDGYTVCAGDCDDNDGNTYPFAPEICDEVDNDCDGAIPADETWDGDGDGYVECLEGASSERGHFGPPIMLLSPRFEGTGTPRSTCS